MSARLPDAWQFADYATFRADRSVILAVAREHGRVWEQDPRHWLAQIQTAPDDTAIKSSINLTHWYAMGLQSVEVSHTLAAALMSTSARGALDGVSLPWPCFEIQIPAGLLHSSHGPLYSVVVSETPDWMPIKRTAGKAAVVVTYYDARTIGSLSLGSIAELAGFEQFDTLTERMEHARPEMLAEYDADAENRMRLVLLRLVVGVVLLINTARADKPQAFPALALRPEKRGVPRANTHRLAHTVTIDCVASVRDFVSGSASSTQHVTTLVRGHWRQQAHGPRHTLRRATWITPFWRGEGPLAERTVRLK